MDSRTVMAGVFGAIALIVSLVLYSPMTKGVDTLYREFVPHCNLPSGESTVQLHVTAMSATDFDKPTKVGEILKLAEDGTSCNRWGCCCWNRYGGNGRRRVHNSHCSCNDGGGG